MNNDGSSTNPPPAPVRTAPGKPGPGKPAPTKEQSRSAAGYLRIFAALLLAMLFTSNLALPWKLVPLALGVAAVVVGIIALVKQIRYGLRPFVRVATSMGLAAAFFMTIGLAAMVSLWPMTEKYEACMDSALTLKAQEGCTQDYTSLDGLLNR